MIVREIETDETVAIRVPDDPFLQSILEDVSELYSTSVNFEGKPELNDVKEIKKPFKKKVDAIGYIKDKKFSQSSTILDVSIYPFKILREGEDLDKVREVLEDL